MAEFEVEGKHYQCTKLTPFQQLGVARRIAPLLAAVAPVLGGSEADLVRAFGSALSGLTDEATEYVFSTCLASVLRVGEDGKAAAIWNSTAKRAMFTDLNDIVTLFPIVQKVIEVNLANFFQGQVIAQSSAAAPS